MGRVGMGGEENLENERWEG
jgi:hypothetical protein